MVNSQVTREIVEALKLDINVQAIPSPIPVIEVGVKQVKRGMNRSQSLANATSGTIFTTPVDQDFYITGANLTFVRDATATSALFNISYTDEGGQSQNILTFAGVTLNLGYGATQTPPMHPIKVARGTNINLNSSTNVGNFKVTAQVYGFIDEVN
jgi:hypothetical protein